MAHTLPKIIRAQIAHFNSQLLIESKFSYASLLHAANPNFLQSSSSTDSRFSRREHLLCFIPSPDPKSGEKGQLFLMAGKAAQSVVKAMGEYQYPWREKLAKYKVELSKGVWGYWELGAWKPLGISARRRARLRKEVILAGQDWPYDPQRKEMRTKMKGHKCDRISAEKRENTANLMQKMPEMLLAYKKRRWEKKMKEEEKLKEK